MLISLRKHLLEVASLQEQLAEATEGAHQAELRAVRAEALAEERKLEVDRLEQTLISQGRPVLPQGGFINVPQADEEEAELVPHGTQQGLLARLDEICGVGLSLEEIERRHDEHRRKEIARLEHERADVITELREMHGTAT